MINNNSTLKGSSKCIDNSIKSQEYFYTYSSPRKTEADYDSEIDIDAALLSNSIDIKSLRNRIKLQGIIILIKYRINQSINSTNNKRFYFSCSHNLQKQY